MIAAEVNNVGQNAPMLPKVTSDNRIDTLKALKMRFRNKNTLQEIADTFGVTRQAVCSHLQGVIAVIDDPHITQQYEENKPEILSTLERKLVGEMLDNDKLKKASLNNVAYAYAQVANQNRLSRGQSTENIGYIDLTSQENEIERELSKLQAMVIPGECQTLEDAEIVSDETVSCTSLDDNVDKSM